MAIVTTSEVKTYLNITGSSYDANIQTLIDSLTAELQRMTGRTFETATFTEYYDGADATSFTLKSAPVTSITSVSAVSIDRTVLWTLASTEYTYEGSTGILSRRGGSSWLSGGSAGSEGWQGSGDLINPIPYSLGDAPVFSDGTFRGWKVVYAGGYSSIPADLKVLFYDVIGMRLATIGADYSLNKENLGHYGYTVGDKGRDWLANFQERVNAWMVYS